MSTRGKEKKAFLAYWARPEGVSPAIKKQEQPMEKRICSPLLASRHTQPSANIVIMVNSVSSLLVFLLSLWQAGLYKQLGKGWGVRKI
jgi:hypothetical protein